MRRSFEDTSEFNPLGTKLRLLFSVNSIASDPVLLGLPTSELRCFSPRSGRLCLPGMKFARPRMLYIKFFTLELGTSGRTFRTRIYSIMK